MRCPLPGEKPTREKRRGSAREGVPSKAQACNWCQRLGAGRAGGSLTQAGAPALWPLCPLHGAQQPVQTVAGTATVKGQRTTTHRGIFHPTAGAGRSDSLRLSILYDANSSREIAVSDRPSWATQWQFPCWSLWGRGASKEGDRPLRGEYTATRGCEEA